MTSDSLSGQNRDRRVAGVRSSRTRSILWNRLRKLDRKIFYIKEAIARSVILSDQDGFKVSVSVFKAADLKRKEVRLMLKGYL